MLRIVWNSLENPKHPAEVQAATGLCAKTTAEAFDALLASDAIRLA